MRQSAGQFAERHLPIRSTLGDWLGIRERLRVAAQDRSVPETSYLRILRRFIPD